MTTNQIRSSFLSFFEHKGNTIIPSAPVMPINDPSTLFNTAGMQPIVPYLLGNEHPKGKRLVDSQKCIRTNDLEEVGDYSHLTSFEMLGHWSMGDYFKKEAIEWIWEWLTGVNYLNLDPSKLYATIYKGDDKIPLDIESKEILTAIFTDAGLSPNERITALGRDDNWWEIADNPNSPAGPDCEIFYNLTDKKDLKFDAESTDFIEICNSVFMTYQKTEEGYLELPSKNVDFGGGLERLAMVVQGKNHVYQIDLFEQIILAIKSVSSNHEDRSIRIIADHFKTAVFMTAENLEPSNTDRGYVLRRLLRRAFRQAKIIEATDGYIDTIIPVIARMYQESYPEFIANIDNIMAIINKELVVFSKTIQKGLREFSKMTSNGELTSADTFKLFDTYGFPLELSIEEAEINGIPIEEDVEVKFAVILEEQRNRSRTAKKGDYKGGLMDHSSESIRYHTATHLMYHALKQILGDHVIQKGSNINKERTRFDFSHSEKLTDEQKKAVEDYVNDTVDKDLEITYEEIPTTTAIENGALGAFGDKYGETVKVYSIGTKEDLASYEICGGPHVKRTSEIGKFKIIKEQSSSQGVRRIKAILE